MNHYQYQKSIFYKKKKKKYAKIAILPTAEFSGLQSLIVSRAAILKHEQDTSVPH